MSIALSRVLSNMLFEVKKACQILGEISCLFSLALEFYTRFRGGPFQPLTNLSASDKAVSSQPSAKADSSAFALLGVGMTKNQTHGTSHQRLTTND